MERTAGATMMMFVPPQSLQAGDVVPGDIFFIQRQSGATEGRQDGRKPRMLLLHVLQDPSFLIFHSLDPGAIPSATTSVRFQKHWPWSYLRVK